MIWSKAAARRRGKLSEDAKRSRASILRWRAAIIAIIIYNIVGIADILSTVMAINSGAGYEANPVIRAAMERAGDGWIAAKLALQGVITVMVLYFPHWIVLGFFAAATAWNALVVYNNFSIAGVF